MIAFTYMLSWSSNHSWSYMLYKSKRMWMQVKCTGLLLVMNGLYTVVLQPCSGSWMRITMTNENFQPLRFTQLLQPWQRWLAGKRCIDTLKPLEPLCLPCQGPSVHKPKRSLIEMDATFSQSSTNKLYLFAEGLHLSAMDQDAPTMHCTRRILGMDHWNIFLLTQKLKSL